MCKDALEINKNKSNGHKAAQNNASRVFTWFAHFTDSHPSGLHILVSTGQKAEIILVVTLSDACDVFFAETL